MKKIIIFAVIGLVVVVGGIVAFLMLSGDKEPKPVEELMYQLPEMYTNIPVGDENDTYKILKLQMTIVYTDDSFTTDVFPKKQDDMIDFINGYFRDTTLATVNRKNGKDRIKEEIAEQLIEMLETDNDNIIRVLMPQFIIQ